MTSSDHPSAANQRIIVEFGGLEPLIRLMMSPDFEVQSNAVGSMANLATHGMVETSILNVERRLSWSTDDIRTRIAKPGALVRLTHSRDM